VSARRRRLAPVSGPQHRGFDIPTLTPFEPALGTVNHRLTSRLRPDFKRTLVFGAAACALAAAVRLYGDLSWSSPAESLTAGAGGLGFVALAVLAVRSAASEIATVSRLRFGDAHANVVALLITLAGYGLTALALLVVLGVPPARLLVSGAVTGVVLGVAAQQSLGNVVAGVVLLLNRPFQVGHDITVRSGALAGPYSGRVLSVGLTYVQLDTDEGVVLLPNSGVLAAAVGPRIADAG
jgi:small conductance mechanosensitive channel